MNTQEENPVKLVLKNRVYFGQNYISITVTAKARQIGQEIPSAFSFTFPTSLNSKHFHLQSLFTYNSELN